jgi:hypothetical protein
MIDVVSTILIGTIIMCFLITELLDDRDNKK